MKYLISVFMACTLVCTTYAAAIDKAAVVQCDSVWSPITLLSVPWHSVYCEDMHTSTLDVLYVTCLSACATKSSVMH